MKLTPEEIVIKDRVRQDIDTGIAELCNSIRELSQLQPVLIDEDNVLIAGARRVRACQLLGIEVRCEIVVKLDDLAKQLKAERDENTCRMPFTPSELVAMGVKLEAVEKPRADERKESSKVKPGVAADKREENFSPREDKGKTTEKVAAALGVSRPTYEKAKAVVEAASKPDAPPEVIEAKAEMDRTGKVDPAFKVVRNVIPIRDTSQTKPRSKPLQQRDVYIARIEITNKVNWLTNKVKATSAGAIEAMPGLASELRQLASDLQALADDVDAKRAEVSA